VDIDGVRVVVTPDCGPAVLGIWRQRILIPGWALSLNREARGLMLRHEREHLRALDPQLLLIATCTALLFPWNAVLWVIVRRLRLAVELDCDNRVLRGRADARAYGSLLLSVCARRGREMPFTVALAERSSMLEQRIKAMTAVTPRRRLHRSIPLLLAVTLLSVAAARTPTPRAPSFGRLGIAAPKQYAVSPQTAKASAAPRADRTELTPTAVDARPLPRLASPESLPRVTVTWDNAPIETVIAAFAAFSNRRITTAPDVVGSITATLVDQPWRRALETIMTRHGLRVEFRADSSVYISTLRGSESRSQKSIGVPPAGHTVSGTVDDADTGAPIPNAHINVAGIQLIGAPNETWSDDRGRFSLRVPDGEAWLDAYARGYEFTRVTLGTTDSVAVFHGRGTADCSSSETLRTAKQGNSRRIESVFEPVLIIDGKVISNAAPTRKACEHSPSRLFYGGIRIF
jgi:hypothetical protein